DLRRGEERRPRALPERDRVAASQDRERAQELELRRVLGEPLAAALDEPAHPLFERCHETRDAVAAAGKLGDPGESGERLVGGGEARGEGLRPAFESGYEGHAPLSDALLPLPQ